MGLCEILGCQEKEVNFSMNKFTNWKKSVDGKYHINKFIMKALICHPNHPNFNNSA